MNEVSFIKIIKKILPWEKRYHGAVCGVKRNICPPKSALPGFHHHSPYEYIADLFGRIVYAVLRLA